jgi:hypothetical protein
MAKKKRKQNTLQRNKYCVFRDDPRGISIFSCHSKKPRAKAAAIRVGGYVTDITNGKRIR